MSNEAPQYPSNKPRPVNINGKDFPSVSAAARALNRSRQTIYAWLRGDIRDLGSGTPRIPTEFMGQHYRSRRAAERAHGLPRDALR